VLLEYYDLSQLLQVLDLQTKISRTALEIRFKMAQINYNCSLRNRMLYTVASVLVCFNPLVPCRLEALNIPCAIFNINICC
jgi:hypothetical protein